MRQGIQSDIRHLQIQQSGCLFLCHCKVAEHITGRSFTDNQIIDFYRQAVSRGIMAANCFINNGNALINMMAGTNFSNRHDSSFDDRNQDAVIIRLNGGAHFIVRIKEDFWDSLDPKRPQAARYKPDQWRWYI